MGVMGCTVQTVMHPPPTTQCSHGLSDKADELTALIINLINRVGWSCYFRGSQGWGLRGDFLKRGCGFEQNVLLFFFLF